MNPTESTTVEIKVEMECACKGCEKKVKKSVQSMKGVKQVQVERGEGKLTVTGSVDPNHVLERVRSRTGKKAEFWPKPESDESPNYASAHATDASPSIPEGVNENYTTVFSDENPNACSIM